MSNLREFYKVDELKQEIADLKKEIRSLGECHVEAHELKDEIADLKERIKEVERDNADLKGDNREEVIELEDMVNQYRDETTKVQEEYAKLEKKCIALKEINGVLKKQLEQPNLQNYNSMENREFLALPENQKGETVKEKKDA